MSETIFVVILLAALYVAFWADEKYTARRDEKRRQDWYKQRHMAHNPTKQNER